MTDQSHVTGVYLTLANMISKTGLAAKLEANRQMAWMAKHDIEVYEGVYLTLGLLLGASGIISVLMYW